MTTIPTPEAPTTPTGPPPSPAPTVPQQAAVLVPQVAGYVGHRTVAMGLRSGVVAALAAVPDGLSVDDLADSLGVDPFFAGVWCRAAIAAGVCDRGAGTYRLAPHMATLLLDTTSPAYMGGVFTLLEQDEVFGRFERTLATGERMWWDDCSPEWIAGVAGTGTPFYTRLVPGGLAQVPGLEDRLAGGCRIVDTACGSGAGVVRMAEHYPGCDVVGVDGDGHSLDEARQRVAAADLAGRVAFMHTPLEELRLDEPATLVVNNISMHECRDIDRVTRAVKTSLEPGGWFVISDFPFPDTDEGLRSGPGRVMSGIQFFEAQIDDQLLPRRYYRELLDRHGFRDVGSFELTPMHGVTHGRA